MNSSMRRRGGIGARLPIGARDGVEAWRQLAIISRDIGARIGWTEEAVERFIVGQVLQRAKLQPAERDMGAVEVDSDDLGRIGGQIGQRVAAARGDGGDALAGTEPQGFEVDDRIFPNLRVDEARKAAVNRRSRTPARLSGRLR